jgi:hypothetical protein
MATFGGVFHWKGGTQVMYFDGMKKKTVSPKNLIYVLHHPSSPRVYVGQTSRGELRFKEHFSEHYLASTERQARTKWIRSLRKRGFEPIVTVLEVCARPEDLNEAESFYIAYFRAIGVPLLNHGDGGEHSNRGFTWEYTDEQLQRHNEAMKQRAASDPNYSAKMSAVSLSQWTEETRKAKSVAMMGNKRTSTPHARAASSAAHKGKPKSAEHKAALSEAKRLRWQDPVYRARQVEAQRRAHRTPEARAKAAEWAKLAGHAGHRTPEYRASASARMKAYLATPEGKAQRSEQTTRLWETDEYRDKVVGSITKGQQKRRERERKETALKEAALKEFDRQHEAWSAVIRDYVAHKPHEEQRE